MARYIDADALIHHLKDEINGCEPPFGGRANGKSIAYGTILGLKSAISFVETLSTDDVVEVVRCKDCKYSNFVRSCSKYECRNGCGMLKYSNDFCSYGERKDTNVPTKKTNFDCIKQMSVDELAAFLKSMVDENETHEVACYGCINFGTHHFDPTNKENGLYECEGCSCEGIGHDIAKWLESEVKT